MLMHRSVAVLSVVLSLLLGVILFLYPVPGTGGIRNLLFLSVLVVLAFIWRLASTEHQSKLSGPDWTYLSPVTLLLILTGWLVIQITLFGTGRVESFNNLLEEWILGGIVFSWLTWVVARFSSDESEDNRGSLLLTLMAIAVAGHVVWLFWYQIPVWQGSGNYPYGSSPYAQRDFISFPVNLAFVVLIADLSTRVMLKKRVLRISVWVSTVLMILSLAAIIVLNTRNGVLSALAAMMLLVIMVWFGRWKRGQQKKAVSMIAVPLLIMAILSIGSLGTDGRWAGFLETVEIATDIENNKYWLDSGKYSQPTTNSGKSVEGSAYLRIAWGMVAIKGIKKHPLGYGYGQGAFGKYIEEEYGYENWVSSHSGILDFTLANGIPATVLWVIFLFTLLRIGWMSFVRGNPHGVLLALMLANFFTRTVLDGHFGGFRLKMFALLMGAIYYLATRPTRNVDPT